MPRGGGKAREQAGGRAAGGTAAPGLQQQEPGVQNAASEPVDVKPAPAPAAETCAFCNKSMLPGQWTVISNSSMRLHFDCWHDPTYMSLAGFAATIGPKAIVTVPAPDLNAMGNNLKTVRRELTQSLKQERATHVALLDAKKLCDKLQDAMCANEKKLQHELAHANKKIKMLSATSLEELEEDKLDELQEELTAALERVQIWKNAEALIALECPEFCCSINIGVLMRDPVITEDGRSYERKYIEKHFNYLKKENKPMMTPQKHMLKSTTLIPNYALKHAISALVKNKVRELLAAKQDGCGAASGDASASAKRARV